MRIAARLGWADRAGLPLTLVCPVTRVGARGRRVPVEVTDDELLLRTRQEPAAFGTFYARHERAVFRFL